MKDFDHCAVCNGPHESDWIHVAVMVLSAAIFMLLVYLAVTA